MTQSIDLRRRGLLQRLRRHCSLGLGRGAAWRVARRWPSLQRQAARAIAASDIGILNTALALENEAISAYQLGAQSGLLQKPVLEVAVLFQTHHKEHRDALIATIRKLGGTPGRGQERRRGGAGAERRRRSRARPTCCVLRNASRRARRTPISASSRRSATAASAQVSARLAADEAMHWTVLTQALKDPLPAKALSFGA